MINSKIANYKPVTKKKKFKHIISLGKCSACTRHQSSLNVPRSQFSRFLELYLKDDRHYSLSLCLGDGKCYLLPYEQLNILFPHSSIMCNIFTIYSFLFNFIPLYNVSV